MTGRWGFPQEDLFEKDKEEFKWCHLPHAPTAQSLYNMGHRLLRYFGIGLSFLQSSIVCLGQIIAIFFFYYKKYNNFSFFHIYRLVTNFLIREL